MDDKLIWQEEQNGKYSVKSCYRLWRRLQSSTRHYGIEGKWKHLWSISVPSRAKHVMADM